MTPDDLCVPLLRWVGTLGSEELPAGFRLLYSLPLLVPREVGPQLKSGAKEMGTLLSWPPDARHSGTKELPLPLLEPSSK